MVKSTGLAKYTYDINLPKQLIAAAWAVPMPTAECKSIDTTAAEKVSRSRVVHLINCAKLAGARSNSHGGS